MDRRIGLSHVSKQNEWRDWVALHVSYRKSLWLKGWLLALFSEASSIFVRYVLVLVPIAGFCFGWISLLTSVVLVLILLPTKKQLRLVLRQMLHKAACMKQPTAFELLSQDKRLPVLFLRSFESDIAPDSKDYFERTSNQSSHIDFEAADGRAVPQLWSHSRPTNTEESAWASAFSEIGPVVAVDQPGANWSVVGAARLPLGDDWKQRVLEMMDFAQCIVVFNMPRKRTGIDWEIYSIFRKEYYRKLVFVLGEHKLAGWHMLRDIAAEHGFKTPRVPPRLALLAYISDAGSLTFAYDSILDVNRFFNVLWNRLNDDSGSFWKRYFRSTRRIGRWFWLRHIKNSDFIKA